MTKKTPCADAPLQVQGRDVSGLYFTKSPGDKYLSVYARYNDHDAWVPLHIALPAIPSLQQTRDMDRNITTDSGSYEDAHLYLRSADGNNMTTAFFANAEGGAIQAGNADGLAPLNLQPEGGLLTYGGQEIATEPWVQAHALLLRDLPVTDFNAMTQPGIYLVPGNLSLIPNYPHIGTNNNGATKGYLLVFGPEGGNVQCFYPTYEQSTMGKGAGFWSRRNINDSWEYKNGVLEIDCRFRPVHADAIMFSGDYMISGSRTLTMAYGFPDCGTPNGIPFMLSVRQRTGHIPNNYTITQELVSIQESPGNLTRKWIRSRFFWNGGNPWDSWNEVGLLRDVYTKNQLNTSGGGGNVHWDNIAGNPVSAGDIANWNAKENTVNKNSSVALGTSDVFYPTQNAVKTYVDNATATSIPLSQKGTADGVATLDNNGKIPESQVPAIAVTNTHTVTSESQMLSLTAETGDVAVRMDISKSFILQAAPASSLLNWIELKSPTVNNSDQVAEGTANLYFTNTRARNALSASAPLTYNTATGTIGMTQAGSANNGFLAAADWNTFNAKEPAIAKNTAFNRNFGTTAGTVAEGNDSRIANGQAAYEWGDHATAGYLQMETDPVWNTEKVSTLIVKSEIHGSADLNSYTETGLYFQSNNAQAASGANYPVPYAGKLEVVNTQTGFIYQTYQTYREFVGLYYRSYYMGVWSAWKSVAETTNALMLKGRISGAENLDDFITNGIWYPIYVPAWVGGGGTNYPTNQRGFLTVKLANDPASGDVLQVYETVNSSGAASPRTYTRKYVGYGGVWSPWVELTTNSGYTYVTGGTTTGNLSGLSSSRSYLGSIYAPADAPGWNSAWWNVISLRHSNGEGDGNLYGLQIGNPMTISTEVGALWFRNHFEGSWGSWYQVATTATAIQNQYASAQNASAWISGNLRVGSNAALEGDKTVIGKRIQPDESIQMVLGYSELNDSYEKIKLIAKRLDYVARQHLFISVNTDSNNSSATEADSRIMIDGTNGNVGIATVAPQETLHVAGTTLTDDLRIGNLMSGVTGTTPAVVDETGRIRLQQNGTPALSSNTPTGAITAVIEGGSTDRFGRIRIDNTDSLEASLNVYVTFEGTYGMMCSIIQGSEADIVKTNGDNSGFSFRVTTLPGTFYVDYICQGH